MPGQKPSQTWKVISNINTIQLFWESFSIVSILVICGPTPLSIQHESMEEQQAINPIIGQRCVNGRLCSFGSWQVRYSWEGREKIYSYVQTKGTISLPEGPSKVKQEKQHSMTGSRSGSQKYSLLFNFHSHAWLKQDRSTCSHAQMGKQAKWTSVEITLAAQLHGKKWTEEEPLFLVTQWDGTQLCSHLTFCCEKKL